MKFNMIFIIVLSVTIGLFIFFSYYRITSTPSSSPSSSFKEGYNNMLEILPILKDQSISPDNKIEAITPLVDKAWSYHHILINNNVSDSDKVKQIIEAVNNESSNDMLISNITPGLASQVTPGATTGATTGPNPIFTTPKK